MLRTMVVLGSLVALVAALGYHLWRSRGALRTAD